MLFLYAFSYLCIYVEQKHNNVYYILRFNILIRGEQDKNMRAKPIFFLFFLFFTAASVAVPIPLFPGNLIATLFRLPFSSYIFYVEAITNGITYGFVMWVVFFIVDKKLEKSMAIKSKKLNL